MLLGEGQGIEDNQRRLGPGNCTTAWAAITASACDCIGNAIIDIEALLACTTGCPGAKGVHALRRGTGL